VNNYVLNGATNDITLTQATANLNVTLGSGANSLAWAAHTGIDALIFSAANGGSDTVFTSITNAAVNDTITFKFAAAFNTVNDLGNFDTIAHGVDAARTDGASGLYTFDDGANTYLYELTAGTTANDELVAIVGATFHMGTIAGALFTLTA